MASALVLLIALVAMMIVGKLLASYSHKPVSKHENANSQETKIPEVHRPVTIVNYPQEKPSSISPRNSYLGITRADAARKHNSWLAGLPKGVYSDAKDAFGRVEVFGYKTKDGELVLENGQAQPIIDSFTGEPVAAGRFLINHLTGGFHKLYLAQEAYLTSEQLEYLYNIEVGANTFEIVEMELKTVTIDGKHGFEFIFY